MLSPLTSCQPGSSRQSSVVIQRVLFFYVFYLKLSKNEDEPVPLSATAWNPKNGDWSNCKVDHWNFLGQKSCWGDLRLLSLHNRKSILQSKESKESKETLKSKESGCSYEFLHWNRAARFILRSVSYFFRKCAFCVISDSIMCHKMCHIFLLQVISYLIVKSLFSVLNIIFSKSVQKGINLTLSYYLGIMTFLWFHERNRNIRLN